MMMTQQALWQHVNRVLVAKCISELQYEECLVPEGGRGRQRCCTG